MHLVDYTIRICFITFKLLRLICLQTELCAVHSVGSLDSRPLHNDPVLSDK